MSDLTPAEQAIFHTYGQEDTERTRAIVAAVRQHIEAEVLSKATEVADAASRIWDGRTKAGFAAREVAREVAELWRDANYELRHDANQRTRGGSDAGSTEYYPGWGINA